MSKKNLWLMDEPVYALPQGFLMFFLAAMAVLLAVGAVVVQEPVFRAMSIFWAAVAIGLMCLLRWLIKKYRMIMDEKGVRMGSKHTLEWTQVRTAAVIQRGDPRWPNYNSRRSDWHFILLSVQEPQKALDKWNFRLEAAKPGRDIRIPYTYRRVRMIEHYLHMELPTFRL